MALPQQQLAPALRPAPPLNREGSESSGLPPPPDMGETIPPPPVSRPLAGTIIGLLAVVFAADLSRSDTVHVGVLFNLCIALTLWSWRPTWVVMVTALSVMLRVLAHNFGTGSAQNTGATDMLNLWMGLTVQTVTGTLIWRQVIVQRRLEAGQREATRLGRERWRRDRRLIAQAEAERDRAQEAQAEAERAKKQAEEAASRERYALAREQEATAQQRKTLHALERVKSLSVALQKAVLPQTMPPFLAGGAVSLGHRYAPAEREMQIGGDFYDLLLMDDDEMRFGVVIGDVAGHGVEAAAQTALVTTTLRAYAFDGAGPDEVLARTARALEGQIESFVSLFFGVYDAHARTLTYANAGHEPPILLRADAPPIPLAPTGPILGVGLFEFTESQVEIGRGDTLVLLTDGLTEARAITGQMLGWDGAAAVAVRRIRAAADSQQIADGILEDARAFAAGGQLTDDVALLVLRVQDGGRLVEG